MISYVSFRNGDERNTIYQSKGQLYMTPFLMQEESIIRTLFAREISSE